MLVVALGDLVFRLPFFVIFLVVFVPSFSFSFSSPPPPSFLKKKEEEEEFGGGLCRSFLSSAMVEFV